jgi:hypothetical protein
MKSINKNKFVTLHFGRNSGNDSICILHLGKEDYFKSPCKYPTESFAVKIEAIANPEMIITALEDEDNFGRNGFSIRLKNSISDAKSLVGFANRGEVMISLIED